MQLHSTMFKCELGFASVCCSSALDSHRDFYNVAGLLLTITTNSKGKELSGLVSARVAKTREDYIILSSYVEDTFFFLLATCSLEGGSMSVNIGMCICVGDERHGLL